ncbi:hypothetical protein U91I_02184 [alpha proteobacterium U9-1i]|nr:hypothetical protein U91I_02184 [alpha proteobacterium U9-1i]
MRFSALVLAVALGACAATSEVVGSVTGAEEIPNPFPVARGSAIAPPGSAAAGRGAPPEGRAGAVDFGQWRSADPVAYASAWQSQMQTLVGADRAGARSALQQSGFACEGTGERLDCRIEIMDNQCAYDWYVVAEAGRRDPAAGFDKMCLGARR